MRWAWGREWLVPRLLTACMVFAFLLSARIILKALQVLAATGVGTATLAALIDDVVWAGPYVAVVIFLCRPASRVSLDGGPAAVVIPLIAGLFALGTTVLLLLKGSTPFAIVVLTPLLAEAAMALVGLGLLAQARSWIRLIPVAAILVALGHAITQDSSQTVLLLAALGFDLAPASLILGALWSRVRLPERNPAESGRAMEGAVPRV